MSLYTDAGAQHIPAQGREVFDVSGAGDTVIATVGTLLGAHADIGSAVRIANKAAGIVVGKLGTAVVHPDELG
jgi:bifunctional ADP-heptose synthase (sugar kinase/adenylyltransferase)